MKLLNLLSTLYLEKTALPALANYKMKWFSDNLIFMTESLHSLSLCPYTETTLWYKKELGGCLNIKMLSYPRDYPGIFLIIRGKVEAINL